MLHLRRVHAQLADTDSLTCYTPGESHSLGSRHDRPTTPAPLYSAPGRSTDAHGLARCLTACHPPGRTRARPCTARALDSHRTPADGPLVREPRILAHGQVRNFRGCGRLGYPVRYRQ